MATFTMELKEVIESVYNESSCEDDWEQPYEEVSFNGVIYGRLPTLPDYAGIGLGTYPIFNENYRKILNGKIIDEYYNREIGTETIDNFKLILRKKMDQIMPFYNQVYETLAIEYGPLDTMRIHSVGSSSNDGTEKVDSTNITDSTNKSGSRVVGSEFPQTMLAGNEDYANNATDANSESTVGTSATTESESNSNTNANSDNLVTGYQGIASDLMMRYRSSLLNVDTMILADIETCFMLVLNNGDEYFATANNGWW